MEGVRKNVRYSLQNRKEGSSQGFLRHSTLYLTNPIEKNRKIKNKFLVIFHPPGSPPGVAHISAQGSNFENRLGQYIFFAQLRLHAKFHQSSMIGLAWAWVGFEKWA